MDIFYDPNSDTFQTRTRRWERDRSQGLIPVVVPSWPTLTRHDIPTYLRVEASERAREALA